MAYYEVKNITNKFNKRDPNFNKVIKVNYQKGLIPYVHDLKPNTTVVISASKLPSSLHVDRAKGFVQVKEISRNQFFKVVNGDDTIAEVKEIKEVKKDEEEKPKKTETTSKTKKTTKRRSYRKSSTSSKSTSTSTSTKTEE